MDASIRNAVGQEQVKERVEKKKRARLSMKVGCTATVTAVPLTHRIHARLLEKIPEKMDNVFSDNSGIEQMVLCVIQIVNGVNWGHISEACEGEI